MFDEFTPFDTLDAKTLSTESESTTIFLLFKCGQALKKYATLLSVPCPLFCLSTSSKKQRTRNKGHVLCFLLLFFFAVCSLTPAPHLLSPDRWFPPVLFWSLLSSSELPSSSDLPL